MEKYYLQYTETTFVNPHGEQDFGGIEKSVIVSSSLGDLHLSLEYDEDNEIVVRSDWSGSEDGYNSQYTTYSYKEITKEEYREFEEIINKYNSL